MPDQPCPYCTPPRAVADALALVGLEQTSPPAPVPSREQLAHQLEQLQAAAAALVADIQNRNGDQFWLCEEACCLKISTWKSHFNGRPCKVSTQRGHFNGRACDEHKIPGSYPTTYAAPLRALIALLPPVKP